MNSTWQNIAPMLDRLVNDTPENFEKRMNFLKEYLQGGGNSSHISAGHALAASVLTAAVLGEKPEIIKFLLENSRAGTGREDFRFDFAWCLLHHFLSVYVKDDLAVSDKHLDSLSGHSLLYELILSLAYESGELAEKIGFFS